MTVQTIGHGKNVMLREHRRIGQVAVKRVRSCQAVVLSEGNAIRRVAVRGIGYG